MLRNINLNEISDGNLYTANDLVRADCGGCHGCSDCCQGMGDSIILDPYDFYQVGDTMYLYTRKHMHLYVQALKE